MKSKICDHQCFVLNFAVVLSDNGMQATWNIICVLYYVLHYSVFQVYCICWLYNIQYVCVYFNLITCYSDFMLYFPFSIDTT